MNIFKNSIAIIITAVVFNSCDALFLDCYEGNGIPDSMDILSSEFDDFDEIECAGTYSIIVQGDTSNRYIRIEGDENLLERIVIEERGTTLYIELEDNECITSELGIAIYIGTPELEYVGLEGSGDIIINDLYEDNLEATISGTGDISVFNTSVSNTFSARIDGSGDINATGKCNYVEYYIDGSGNIYADNFKSNHCSIDIDGTCHAAYVYANSSLDVKIDGTGFVYYSGSVTEDNITTDIDGYGKVEPGN